MQHDLTIDGFAFRLRPVVADDAAFITALRTDARRSRFIHRTAPDVAAQRAWIERYRSRPGDYYFVVERRADGVAEGTIGIYDLDDTRRCAEWGRWVLRPGSLAAPESAWLVYRVGFERLPLDLLYSRTVAANARVVSFHAGCGLTTHATLTGAVVLDGVAHDLIEQHMRRADWSTWGPRLAAQAERVARLAVRAAQQPGAEGPARSPAAGAPRPK